MKITKDIAFPIIQRLSQTVKYNINIIDRHGVIIASTDENRLNSIHEGAKKVLDTKSALIIYKDQTNQFMGTKEGVNLPIEFMEEIIGVVGITGAPEELLQLAEMTKITVELMLQQNYIRGKADVEQQMMDTWIGDFTHSSEKDEKLLAKHALHFLHFNVEEEVVIGLIDLPQLHNRKDLEGYIKRTEIKNELTRFVSRNKQGYNVVFFGMTMDDFLIFGLRLLPNQSEFESVNRFYNRLKGQFQSIFNDARVGLGNRNNSITGLRKSFSEAKQCLELMKTFKKDANISQIKEWGLIRLLHQIPITLREEYVREYPIDVLPAELQKTLDVLFECDHNLTETARRLHIHRNTLAYRLDNIHQLLHLNPRSVNDLHIIQTIMLMQKLNKEN
ncbi:CdaR family transcriptional regulator [Bacillus pinisoli]|uniref:CdaR family transcriptional regulator n=1 Tax=Bacillus pinisoli TaxID=2901866 RepID=UPI001FF20F06|nr:sugar diacid recognition domain-containing protein [Bacillus pinisoli]